MRTAFSTYYDPKHTTRMFLCHNNGSTININTQRIQFNVINVQSAAYIMCVGAPMWVFLTSSEQISFEPFLKVELRATFLY